MLREVLARQDTTLHLLLLQERHTVVAVGEDGRPMRQGGLPVRLRVLALLLLFLLLAAVLAVVVAGFLMAEPLTTTIPVAAAVLALRGALVDKVEQRTPQPMAAQTMLLAAQVRQGNQQAAQAVMPLTRVETPSPLLITARFGGQ